MFTKDIEPPAVEYFECDTDNESLASTASKRARVEEPPTAGASDDKRKWTTEEEEDLVEYIKAHPYIYDKSLKDHKNTQLKDSIYSAFGLKIGGTAAQVRKWYENKCIQYVKVAKKTKVSGSGRVSHRDNWLLDRFSFLRSHVVLTGDATTLGFASKVKGQSKARSGGSSRRPEPSRKSNTKQT